MREGERAHKTIHNQNVSLNRQIVEIACRTTVLLSKQELAFRGYDESHTSLNRGNFKEIFAELMKLERQEVRAQYEKKNNKIFSCDSKIVQNDLIEVLTDKNASKHFINDVWFCYSPSMSLSFEPMKTAWRSILNSYKESEAGVKHTIMQKQHFPRLLKALMEALMPNSHANLRSGFRKCGIHPCKVDELLQRLPETQHDSSEIENSFIDFLQKTRAEVVGNTSSSLSRRKKILVSPGKSVAHHSRDDAAISDSEDDPDIPNDISMHDSSSGPEDFSDLAEPDIGSNNNKTTESTKKVGAFVVFKYEGEIFPGQIKSFDKEKVVISSMQRSLQAWKWPDQPDILEYSWNDVESGLSEPKSKNKRGYYSVPELENIWT
ncbi:hypothetical protein WDU94_014012 [Cyamophila willieti]